jgi:hypothetical protein
MISSSQRPLPDNTQHSQETDIHYPGGIRTHNLSISICNILCTIFVWHSESCVAIISFSDLLSNHTRQSNERVLFTNKLSVYTASTLYVHYFAFPILRTPLIMLFCVVCLRPFLVNIVIYFSLFFYNLCCCFKCWIRIWLISCVDLKNIYFLCFCFKTANNNEQINHQKPGKNTKGSKK